MCLLRDRRPHPAAQRLGSCVADVMENSQARDLICSTRLSYRARICMRMRTRGLLATCAHSLCHMACALVESMPRPRLLPMTPSGRLFCALALGASACPLPCVLLIARAHACVRVR